MKVTRDMIDPQLRFMGSMLKLMQGSVTKEKAIKAYEKPPLYVTLIKKLLIKNKGYQVDEQWIPRENGSKMRILVMKPLEPKQGVPGILNIHGGGYIMGDAEGILYPDKYIDASDCVIVSPEYRLAVETPYPAALEDCYTALLWLKENSSSLGVRDDQIAVTGESGGGGLTAATTLYARDKGEVNVAFQMPLYPMIDDRNNSESAKDNDAPGWDCVSNETGWRFYLGDLWGTDDVSAYAAPARATDYSNLPPTFTFVGALDPFCSETVAYVESLRAAGVPAEVNVYEGAYHGFDLAKNADVTKNAHARMMEWFEKAVREYTALQPDVGSEQ